MGLHGLILPRAKTLDYFPTLRQLNADEILQTWRVIPPAHRQAFLPLLQEIIDSQTSSKLNQKISKMWYTIRFM
jgi:hypothetical protein